MDAKSRVWLLAGAAAALAGGVTWKMLHHRDVPTPGPAAQASATPAAGSDTRASSSVPGEDRTAAASKSVEASRPDSSGAMGGVIGGVIGGIPNNAALHRARGVIVSHTKHSLVIATASDGNLEFDIPKAMEQTTRLEKGQRVVVGYTEENGRKIANSITRVESDVAAKPAAPNG